MEHCQQTFHWNHIKPLLFPHFCTLTLSIAPCLFISLILNPLLPLSLCFCPPSFSLPPHPSHPLGLLAFFSLASDSFFKPVRLFLSARTWQHSANLLMPPCQRFGMWSSYGWELRCALDAETSQEIIHFIFDLVQRMCFYQGVGRNYNHVLCVRSTPLLQWEYVYLKTSTCRCK